MSSHGNVEALRKLHGKRILLIEDEYLIVQDMVRAFEAAGAIVVGPVASLQAALELVMANAPLDGAVLDINLQGDMVWPLADTLVARGVPFIFATGYSRQTIPARFAGYPSCEKPATPAHLADVLGDS